MNGAAMEELKNTWFGLCKVFPVDPHQLCNRTILHLSCKSVHGDHWHLTGGGSGHPSSQKYRRDASKIFVYMHDILQWSLWTLLFEKESTHYSKIPFHCQSQLQLRTQGVCRPSCQTRLMHSITHWHLWLAYQLTE